MSSFNNWQLAVSTNFSDDIAPEIAASKIPAIELSSSYEYYYNTLDFVSKYADFKAKAEKYGVRTWSIHLPFSGRLDISLFDDELRAFTIKTNLELIEAASKAGFEVAVVHPSSEPIAEQDRPKRLEYSKNSLALLADRAASLGMRLAVENLPRTCLCRTSSDMKYLLEDNPNLYVVFDTNHCLIQDNIEYIKDIGSRIITLHVSDYDFIDERHQLPLAGKNDWKGIIRTLEDIGYCGPWLYEVGLGKSVMPKDICENKQKLSGLL